MTKHNSLTDLELVNLLKQDNDAAFTEIYYRYAKNLAGFASSKLYNLEESRDVIHDVFVRLWEERKLLKIDRNLEAYLYTTVRYRIVDKIRKNITRESYREMAIALETKFEQEIEQQIAEKELKQAIGEAIHELSTRVKEIYCLSREENLSIPEIAVKLELSEQTVKNQLSVALKHLRSTLTHLTVSALLYCWLN